MSFIENHLGTGTTGDSSLYMGLFFVLIIFFTYFYVSITFNPTEVADNMKKYGGFIPGIRPGRPTAQYLNYVLARLTAPGSLYLGLIALVPMVAFALLGVGTQFPFGGTSILIAVGVGLERKAGVRESVRDDGAGRAELGRSRRCAPAADRRCLEVKRQSAFTWRCLGVNPVSRRLSKTARAALLTASPPDQAASTVSPVKAVHSAA